MRPADACGQGSHRALFGVCGFGAPVFASSSSSRSRRRARPARQPSDVAVRDREPFVTGPFRPFFGPPGGPSFRTAEQWLLQHHLGAAVEAKRAYVHAQIYKGRFTKLQGWCCFHLYFSGASWRVILSLTALITTAALPTNAAGKCVVAAFSKFREQNFKPFVLA